MRTHPLEFDLRKEGFLNIAGIDEAGRGPWAGPLVSAAVCIKPNAKIPSIIDSKKIPAEKRMQIFSVILKKADVGIGIVTNIEIDRIYLGESLKLAYKRAVENIKCKPDYLLIDGIGKYNFNVPYMTVKRGDGKIRCIAAASIVAKVVRDIIMDTNAKTYPDYCFEKHKGYGTKLHQKKLLEYGVCPLHRQSFEPVKELIYASKKT
jgi:ribonuclease HII